MEHRAGWGEVVKSEPDCEAGPRGQEWLRHELWGAAHQLRDGVDKFLDFSKPPFLQPEDADDNSYSTWLEELIRFNKFDTLNRYSLIFVVVLIIVIR